MRQLQLVAFGEPREVKSNRSGKILFKFGEAA